MYLWAGNTYSKLFPDFQILTIYPIEYLHALLRDIFRVIT
jgi:hypothetical protein